MVVLDSFLRKRKWAVGSEYNRVGLGLRTFRRDMSRHLLRLESRQACLLRQQQQQQQKADFAASPKKKYYFNIRKKHSSTHKPTCVLCLASFGGRRHRRIVHCIRTATSSLPTVYFVSTLYLVHPSSPSPFPTTTRQTERVTLLKGGFTG